MQAWLRGLTKETRDKPACLANLLFKLQPCRGPWPHPPIIEVKFVIQVTQPDTRTHQTLTSSLLLCKKTSLEMAQCKEDRYIKGESKDTMGDVRERALALGACLPSCVICHALVLMYWRASCFSRPCPPQNLGVIAISIETNSIHLFSSPYLLSCHNSSTLALLPISEPISAN